MALLDLLYPKKCVSCGKWGDYVCQNCQIGLWEEEQINPPVLDGLVNLWAYASVAQKLIKLAKYKGQWDALKFLILNFKFLNNPQLANFQKFLQMKPIVVPVPLHPKREFERGFNQAKIISQSLSKLWHLELNDCLIRTKDTGHQTNRNRQQRLEAMQGAFALSTKYLVLSTVLLVDDVWTTGATMSECCKVLKRAGVKTVWGLVLAR